MIEVSDRVVGMLCPIGCKSFRKEQIGTRAAGRSFTSCLQETERKISSCDVIKGSTLPLSQDSAPDHTLIKLFSTKCSVRYSWSLYSNYFTYKNPNAFTVKLCFFSSTCLYDISSQRPPSLNPFLAYLTSHILTFDLICFHPLSSLTLDTFKNIHRRTSHISAVSALNTYSYLKYYQWHSSALLHYIKHILGKGGGVLNGQQWIIF